MKKMSEKELSEWMPGDIGVVKAHITELYQELKALEGIVKAAKKMADWSLPLDYDYADSVDIVDDHKALQVAIDALAQLPQAPGAGVCPNDTDGDGNCGRTACPVCGIGKAEP